MKFKFWHLLVLSLFILLTSAGGFYYWRLENWKWEKILLPDPIAQVNKNMPPRQLGELLQKNGKLRDVSAFEKAARDVKLSEIAAGFYELPARAGPRELIAVFSKPANMARVTFPEGWTAKRMASRLSQLGFTAATQFSADAYPANQFISPWEGKLFPNTYLWRKSASAEEIRTDLLNQYRKITSQLPRPFPKGHGGKVLSLHEITVLASLVERETDVPSERPLIAGVLLNRLRINMRLQCDATVQYARERAQSSHTNRLLYSDLKIDSPYNTYRHYGLPPGAICNPGKAALEAAARPKVSEYLFYVWSPKLKRHLFSKTYQEHLTRIKKVRTERSQ